VMRIPAPVFALEEEEVDPWSHEVPLRLLD
jgi:hypothetical protein